MNLGKLSSWIHYILKYSCVKLLASKYKLGSQTAVFKKFGRNLKGTDKVGFVNAIYKIKQWDFKSKEVDTIASLYAETISAASLSNLSCAKCGSTYRVEMHHIKKLRDLNPKARYLDLLPVGAVGPDRPSGNGQKTTKTNPGMFHEGSA